MFRSDLKNLRAIIKRNEVIEIVERLIYTLRTEIEQILTHHEREREKERGAEGEIEREREERE